PDELVEVELTEEKATFARGSVVKVLEPSVSRVVPPCPHVSDGCGGCDWQHASEDLQRSLRQDIVAEVLQRSAKLDHPTVVPGPALAAEGLRTTVRGVAGPDGRFGFH